VAFSAGSFSRYAGENTYSSAFTARLPTAYMPASGPEVNSQRKRSAVRPSVAGTCQVLTAAPAPSSSQLVGSGRRTVKRTAAGSAAQYLAWSVAVPASRVAVQKRSFDSSFFRSAGLGGSQTGAEEARSAALRWSRAHERNTLSSSRFSCCFAAASCSFAATWFRLSMSSRSSASRACRSSHCFHAYSRQLCADVKSLLSMAFRVVPSASLHFSALPPRHAESERVGTRSTESTIRLHANMVPVNQSSPPHATASPCGRSPAPPAENADSTDRRSRLGGTARAAPPPRGEFGRNQAPPR